MTRVRKIRKPAIVSDASAPPRAGDLLRDLDRETICVNGANVSVLEAEIRLLYSRSLKHDIGASIQLQRIRDRCGSEKLSRPVGCLAVPGPMAHDEFERLAYKQQAPFREKQDFN